MKHWSEPLVGLPWAKLGRDPAGTDCLGLARLGGADLPLFGPTVDDTEKLWRTAPSWRQVQEAREGDLVVFGHRGIEDHVGLIVGPSLMLHIEAARDEPGSTSESVIERWDTPKWQRRLLGVYRRSDIALARTLPPADPDAVTVVGLSFIDPGRDPLPVAVPQGDSLAELVWQAYPEANERQRAALRVTIGDHVFPADAWPMVKPRAGSVVVVMPLPGFNWQALLTVIVTIAAASLGQFYLGPLLASGFTGFAAQAITAGTTLALTLGASILLGLILPKPEQQKSKDVFSLQGFQNEPRPDAPFPLHFGKRRQAPVVGGRTWIEIYNKDESTSPGVSSGVMYIRALFIEGIIGPQANLVLSELKFGDTKLYKPEDEWADPDVPEFHFRNLEMETIDWYPGDPPPKLYDHQVVPTDQMGQTLVHDRGDAPGVPEIRTSAHDGESYTLILAFPQGLVDFDDQGNLEEERVRIKIEVQIGGEDTWSVLEEELTIREKKPDPFWFKYDYVPPVRLPQARSFRVTRLTADNNEDDAARYRVDWLALYTHRPESPLGGQVGLKVTAFRIEATKQLQGTISSYNNLASRTCPDWDAATGTWIVRETSNPASALRFAMQGPQNIFPKSDTEINLSLIQNWHEWCDLRNLKFDYVSEDNDTAPALRNLIAASGRASPHHDGSQWGIVIDREQPYVRAHVSAHNVLQGSFGKARNFQAERFPDAFRVLFADADNDYQRAERIVPWPGKEGTSLQVFVEVDLPWETDAGRSWIEARRRQYEQIHRPRTYRASMDWEHLKLGRFDRALINHHVVNRRHASARVESVNGQTVTLSGEVEMVDGESYGVVFRHIPDEVDEAEGSPPFETITRGVMSAPGKTKRIVLTGPGGVPEPGDLAMFGGTVEAIVKSIKRAGKLGADLTFLDYAPQYYALTDAEIPPAWDGRTGEVGDSIDPAPALVTAMMFNIAGGELLGFGHFTWAADLEKRYQIEWRKVGTDVVKRIDPPAGISEAVTTELVAADNYEGRVRVQGSSLWSVWTIVPDVTLLLADTEILLEADSGILLQAG